MQIVSIGDIRDSLHKMLILFSRKNKKNFSLSSAESDQCGLSVKLPFKVVADILKYVRLDKL